MIKSNIYLLSLFNFFCDFVPYAPIAVLYFYQITHSYALSMSIFSITMLGSAIFEVPTGILSDRVGRKLTIIYGTVFRILAVFLYAIASSYFVLAIGALMEGVSRSFYSGNNDALLYESIGEGKDKFAKYQGKVNSMFQIGLAVSGLIGSYFSLWSLSAVFWISLIPQLISLIVVLRLIEPERKSNMTGNLYNHLLTSIKYSFSHEKLRLINFASAIEFAAGESMYKFRVTFISMLWPVWSLGILSTFGNIFASMGYFVAHKFIKRLGLARPLILQIIVNRIIGFAALIHPTIISPAIMSSSSFFYGIGQVSQDTILQREFTEKERATLGSINSFIGSILFGVLSFLIGFLGDKLGPASALIIMHIIIAFSLVFYLRFYQLEKVKK